MIMTNVFKKVKRHRNPNGNNDVDRLFRGDKFIPHSSHCLDTLWFCGLIFNFFTEFFDMCIDGPLHNIVFRVWINVINKLFP